MIQQAFYSSFTFVSAVDDDYTSASPSLFLKYRKFWREIQVMVVNNGDEGLIFTPFHVQFDEQFRVYIKGLLPGCLAEDLDKTFSVVFCFERLCTSGRNQISRIKQALADAVVNYNTDYLIEAYGPEYTYKYVFNMNPATHGLKCPFYGMYADALVFER